MALTSEDLKNITGIVNKAFSGLATKSELKDAVSGLATKSDISGLKSDISGLKSEISGLKSEVSGLKLDLDRMEGRLISAINLLQRDSYSRLDDHDVRIRRLEDAAQR